MKTILFIYGTRPEAIKMAPLIREFKKYPQEFDIKICLTGQHRQMLDQINMFFGINGDFDLNLMAPDQTLFDITARCLLGLNEVLNSIKPDLIFVQGDTTSVMAGAIAGIYKKIPIAHLEAGLRSGNKYSPFPEEINRIVTAHIADFHFSPTKSAMKNLRKEGIKRNVYVVGNTVIDALHLGILLINKSDSVYQNFFSYLDLTRKIILITGHRRESFGDGFENICSAIKTIAEKHVDVQFVYPVHMNPKVREPVNRILQGIPNVYLLEPLDYPYLIWLMQKSYFIVTDSGGIQEEGPALGKPVLVLRNVTERKEGIQAGTAKLIGTEYNSIINGIDSLLLSPKLYAKMSGAVNPYGDGKTSELIVSIIREKKNEI